MRLACACSVTGCEAARLCALGEARVQIVQPGPLARGCRLPEPPAGRRHLHVVRRGLVATCAGTSDGRRQILFLSLPGDVVCPMVHEDAECWSEALAETELCTLIARPAPGCTEVGPSLRDAMFDLVHRRLRASAMQLLVLGQLEAAEKLCYFLAAMLDRAGQRRGRAWRLHLPMSREDIADHLGLNADTVSRTLARLSREGLIRILSRSVIEVPELGLLKARLPTAFQPAEPGTGGLLSRRSA